MTSAVSEFQRKFDKEVKTGLISMLVLLTIARDDEPSYGYRIIKTIQALSDGQFQFPEGTIYPILASLSGKGLLESYWGDAKEGPRRKYYKLTREGRKALKASLAQWGEVVRTTGGIISRLEGKR